MKRNDEVSTSRRGFLRSSVGLGAGAAAAALASGTAVAATVEEKVEEQASADQGYRLTQHIADYYKTAAL